ncbi:MAG: type II secretion system minor pseudopilin GspK [Rhizobium sp.]|nr:type II secretion system minor pseudopilin GspK [Rhizobium sp.]
MLAALMVAALATLLASRLLVAQDDFVSMTVVQRDLDQTRRLALGAVDLARAVLLDDRARGNVDHLGEPWATAIRDTPAEQGRLSGHIDDAQARFNLLSLVGEDGDIDAAALAAYQRLVSLLGLDSRMAETLAAWLKSKQKSLPPGQYYLPGFGDLIGELSVLPGYSTEALAVLRPYVIVLPTRTPVNLNTAPPMLLAAVTALPLPRAGQVAADRMPVWFREVVDFRQRHPDGRGDDRLMATRSSYFEVVVDASQNGLHTRLKGLLHRRDDRVDVIAFRYGE